MRMYLYLHKNISQYIVHFILRTWAQIFKKYITLHVLQLNFKQNPINFLVIFS